MSGEVNNNASINTRYAQYMDKLNSDVKSGKTTTKEAQQALLEFRKENQIGEFAPKTVSDAELEAKESAGAAFGFTKTTTQNYAASTTPTADAAKGNEEVQQNQKPKEYTPIQELLLKQGQAKYPDNDVTLDDKGNIIVKDKKTGEIDEAKTKEAKEIKVDGSTSEVTIKEGSAKPDVKLTVPNQKSVEDMKQYDTKKEAHNEFTTGSKADTESAKADYEKQKDQIKDLQDEAKRLDKEGNYQESVRIRVEIAMKEKELQKLENKYENAKALSSTRGERGIARAAKRNAKNYDNIDNVHQVFTSKAARDAYLKEHPEEKDHAVVLSKKQNSTLSKAIGYSQAYIKIAEEDLANATDPAAKAEAEARLNEAKAKYGDLATCMDEKGNIDAKKLQSGLMVFSGADGRFNIDEKDEVAKKFGLSRSKVRSLASEVGFGNESATLRRFGAAGAAAAATALGSLIGPHKKTARSESHASSTATQTVTQTASETATATAHAFDEQTSVEIYKFLDSSGNPVFKEISATAKAEATETVSKTATATATATATTTAVADAVASACAKVPVLGQLAGPVIAGISAFIIANPQSKDAFNGNSVDTVLENLNAVSGRDNKKIVAQIQNMEITGDTTRDKAIKAAVIEASLGGESAKANTEELLAAYQNLVDTKNALDKINNLPPVEEPTVATTPTVPSEPTISTTPTVPSEPCTDWETRNSHSEPIPSREVMGHGQSPYWIAKGYINSNGEELTPAQRKEVQKLLGKEENKQVQERGNFNGSRIGYRYRKEITLSDGTVVKLADDAAKRIGTGKMVKTRKVIKNGKMIIEQREVDCETRKPVDGPTGQWHRVE